jgi:predicted DNA-binding transcriptional regulator AlpA
MITLPTLDEIAIDETPATIEALGALVAALARRQREGAVMPVDNDAPDEMLDVQEAARRLNKSTSWLYHHANLPFRVKIGGGVRFSAAGIAKWLKARAGR